MKSAVTISLVSEAREGPFVFRDDFAVAVEKAASLGFDAVELFFPDPEVVPLNELRSMLNGSGLNVAAVGTGAGMLRHQLSLVDQNPEKRRAAREYITRMIQFGGELGAPAIIGSMQGRWTPEQGREQALDLLAEGLHELGAAAARWSVPLLYEPLNRYETNLLRTQGEAAAFLKQHGIQNIRLLADLFHMNIEEVSIEEGLRAGAEFLGHVHFVDSNRRPAGYGHLDFASITAVLREIGYDGYLSAEAFAWPDSDTAAAKTMETFRKFVR